VSAAFSVEGETVRIFEGMQCPHFSIFSRDFWQPSDWSKLSSHTASTGTTEGRSHE